MKIFFFIKLKINTNKTTFTIKIVIGKGVIKIVIGKGVIIIIIGLNPFLLMLISFLI